MLAERDRRVESLYHAALERPAAVRDAFLADACGDDDALRLEVASLVALADDANGFLERPALASPTPGQTLGAYTLEVLIGAGGMGEVYKARDTRLDRIVAIKILPQEFAADPHRLHRFEQEARAIAALNDPHICTLHDVGECNGTPFLVMELVEGETIAERLARATPMPLDEVLRDASQIAHALDAAHRHGIVHRDLKPGNVMLTKTGVKLLDFGVAKLRHDPIAVDSASRLPDQIVASALVGTLPYMSPEQIEGGAVDARSDIFSFGAILFEMLTSQRALEGMTQATIVASILRAGELALAEVPQHIAALSAPVRRRLDRVLHRCLARDPDDRWQSAADLAAELAWIDAERSTENERGESADDRTSAQSRERYWMVATVLALIAASALGAWAWLRPPAPRPSEHLELLPPDGYPFDLGPATLAISPDGLQMVFVADRRLWHRALDGDPVPQPVPALEVASQQPVWSPNGRFIGLCVGSWLKGTLKKIDAVGGQVFPLAGDCAVGGAAWSPTGVIVYVGPQRNLYQVPEGGGASRPATELDAARLEDFHASPSFLPDGHRFVFFAHSLDASKSAVFLASLDSPTRTRLFEANSSVQYANGFLIYQQEGALLARPFDERTGETGEPVALDTDVYFHRANRSAAFSASANGTLIYRKFLRIQRTLTWFDRNGHPASTIGEPGLYSNARPSHDGRRLVMTKTSDSSQNGDLWIVDDLSTGRSWKMTSDRLDDDMAVWLPDDKCIAFSSNRTGQYNLYAMPSSGVRAEELLLDSPEEKFPSGSARSPRGDLLLFTLEATGRRELWAQPMTSDCRAADRAFPLTASTAIQGIGLVSPDGKWMVFDELEGVSSNKVFVQRFAAPGNSRKIPVSPGCCARWTASGTRMQILYKAQDQNLAVDVTEGSDGEPSLGPPHELFTPARAVGPLAASGDRLLFLVSPERPPQERLEVWLNWPSTLARK